MWLKLFQSFIIISSIGFAIQRAVDGEWVLFYVNLGVAVFTLFLLALPKEKDKE